MNKLTFLIVFLFLISLVYASPRQVIRYDSPSTELLQSFLDANADIASYRPGEYLDIVVDNEELARLTRQTPGFHITQTEQQLKSNLQSTQRTIPGYNTYAEIVASLSDLTVQYPELLYMENIGSTWGAQYSSQGISYYNAFDQDIWAIKLSDNAVEEEEEPSIYFFGDFHAREPIGTQVCLNLLNHLIAGYGTDPQITDLINSTQIWFIPVANPNGHKIVLDQTDVWWRKNIRDNNDNHMFDHQTYGYGVDGVDLNRNWSYQWGYMSATDNMQEPTYHGTPNSEIETQAIANFLDAHHFIAGISYHSYSELVLYPYGYVGNIFAPDYQEISSLATAMASTIPKYAGGTYDASPSWGLYPATGSFDDWSYGTKGIFGYTIELATEFIPPATDVPDILNGNIEAAMLLLNRKNHSMLTGKIIDSTTDLPLEATVFVEGIDSNPVPRAPYKSDISFGSYYRFLPPGEYTVRYTADQYQSVVTSVVVTAEGVTVENVEMTPVQAHELVISVVDDFFGPLEGAVVSLPSLNADTFVTNDAGQITLDPFYYGYYQVQVSKAGFETLLKYINIDRPNITLRITSMAIYADDFESGMGQWTRTGTWNTTNTDQYAGSNCLTDRPNLNYLSNSNYYCKFNTPINLTNQTNANLQFYIKSNLILDGDYVALQYSTDGTNWFTVDHYTGVSDWGLKSYSLNAYLNNTVYIRFLIVTTDSDESAGVFIDDFSVFIDGDSVENNDLLIPISNLAMSIYPNPFSSKIKLNLSSTQKMNQPLTVAVYNLRGQAVTSLYKNILTKGTLELEWNGLDSHGKAVSNGVYFIRTTSDGKMLATKKVLLLK